MFKHLLNSSRSIIDRRSVRPARAVRIVLTIAFILAIPLLLFTHALTGAASAILYMFAFDGKVSGRMDGNVLASNGRGRAFVKPSNPNTPYQLAIRGAFSTFSGNYKGLTGTQLSAWNAFSMSISNRLGQSKTIYGKECYVRLNCNLVNAGQAPISSPPLLVGVPAIPNWDVTAAAGAGTISATFNGPVPANTVVVVRGTPSLNLSRFRPVSKFKDFSIIATAATSPAALGGIAYTARFGSLVAGKKLFIEAIGINTLTGERSILGGASCVIAP